MKKTLNVPAVTKKTPQAAAGPSRPNTANKQVKWLIDVGFLIFFVHGLYFNLQVLDL